MPRLSIVVSRSELYVSFSTKHSPTEGQDITQDPSNTIGVHLPCRHCVLDQSLTLNTHDTNTHNRRCSACIDPLHASLSLRRAGVPLTAHAHPEPPHHRIAPTPISSLAHHPPITITQHTKEKTRSPTRTPPDHVLTATPSSRWVFSLTLHSHTPPITHPCPDQCNPSPTPLECPKHTFTPQCRQLLLPAPPSAARACAPSAGSAATSIASAAAEEGAGAAAAWLLRLSRLSTFLTSSSRTDIS